MEDLIMTGYEFWVIMIPAAIMIVIYGLMYKRRNMEKTGGHILLLAVFAVYLFGVFYVTGAGTIFHIKQYGMEFHPDRLNLIPFSDIKNEYVEYYNYVLYYGLNIVLFMPLGFLLPLIWPKLNKMKSVLIAGISLSLLVEISQLLNIRSTDIDDLIANTAGAILGFFIFRLYVSITKKDIMPIEYCKYEAAIYIAVMFLCRFFFYNELGMAKLLYGF